MIHIVPSFTAFCFLWSLRSPSAVTHQFLTVGLHGIRIWRTQSGLLQPPHSRFLTFSSETHSQPVAFRASREDAIKARWRNYCAPLIYYTLVFSLKLASSQCHPPTILHRNKVQNCNSFDREATFRRLSQEALLPRFPLSPETRTHPITLRHIIHKRVDVIENA